MIRRQYEIELEARKKAQENSLARSLKNIKSKKGSQSNSGIHIISKTIPKIVKAMATDIMDGVKTGHRREADFYTFMMEPGVLDYVRLEDMANIGLSYLLDEVGSGDKFVPLTKLQRNIGDAIEDQARLVMAQQANPQFVEYLSEKYFNVQNMTRKRKSELSKLELDVHKDPRLQWENWDVGRVITIGSWVLWLITVELPWFQIEQLKLHEEKHTARYIFLSEEGKKQRQTLEEAASKRAHARPIMVIPPSPWVLAEHFDERTGKLVESFEGGYLTELSANNSIGGRLIHGPKALVKTQPGDKALAFLNHIQDIPWKINTWVLDLLKYFSEDNIEIGSFVSYHKQKFIIPTPSAEVMALPDDDERKIEARKLLRAAYTKQQDMRNKSTHPLQVVAFAEECKDEPYFWIPWFFDQRLRAYPLVSKISPQGTDMQKALLLFADGAEVTEENRQETWEALLIAIATTYGNKKDKLSFYERMQWAKEYVQKNLDIILGEPRSPESMAIWTEAEEPFQHLALLKELKEVFIDQTSTTCYVPIGYDATCSGLQLLGSFVRDVRTCELVNVLPSPNGIYDAPRDAYKAVADEAIAILSDETRWRALKGMEEIEEHGIPLEKIDRKVAKKVVMLIPYGGTYPTLKNHVAEATKDWGLQYNQVHCLTKALIQGMADALPGFFALNQWFKQAGKQVMNMGKESVVWKTLAGTVVEQVYRESLCKPVQTFMVNKAKIDTREHTSKRHDDNVVTEIRYLLMEERSDHARAHYGFGDVLKRKNETALAANWTHSQDATVLQLAFYNFEQPFTTVHDCLYAPAPVIKSAVAAIRQSFVRVVSSMGLLDFVNANELEIALPPMGDADITQALSSEYLFS